MFSFPIKNVAKLHKKKYRNEFGAYLVEGEKGVHEALDAEVKILGIYATEEAARKIENEIKNTYWLEVVSEAKGQKLSATNTFSGILAVVKKPAEVTFTDGHIVCLDRIADPGNVGTIIRTADWYGIDNILLSEESVDPYNPKIVRSTMGSFFRANIEEHEDVRARLKGLKDDGYTLVALAMDGTDISGYTPSAKTVFIFGSESHGVREEILEMCDVYTIPGKGKAESLNVAVAAGIALYKMTF